MIRAAASPAPWCVVLHSASCLLPTRRLNGNETGSGLYLKPWGAETVASRPRKPGTADIR